MSDLLFCLKLIPLIFLFEGTIYGQFSDAGNDALVKRAADYVRHQRLSDNKSIVEILNAISKRWDSYNTMDFSDSQKLNLSLAIQEYHNKQEPVLQSPSRDAVISTQQKEIQSSYAQARCKSKIESILLDHQLEELKRCDIRTCGLAKVVLDYAFGDRLNLTKKQERDMEREVKQLVADISEFEDNLKKRSLDLVIDSLSSEQRKILFELINEKALTAIAQGKSINQIRHHHTVSFQTPPIPEIVLPTDRNRRLIQDIGRFEIPKRDGKSIKER